MLLTPQHALTEYTDRTRSTHYWERKNAEVISKRALNFPSSYSRNYCISHRRGVPSHLPDMLPHHYFTNHKCGFVVNGGFPQLYTLPQLVHNHLGTLLVL